MMRALFLVILCSFMFTTSLFAQSVSLLVSTFEKANAALLTDQLNREVNFIYGTEDLNCTKVQFITQLNNFLRQNSPKSFVVVHEGGKADSKFVIGVLTTNRSDFRVHIFYKKINNQYLIHQVRIESSNE